jgi:hypothetical protein
MIFGSVQSGLPGNSSVTIELILHRLNSTRSI